MIIFITLISAVLGGIWYYIYKSLVVASHLSPPVQWTLTGILVVSFVLQVLRWIDRLNIEGRPKILFITYFFLGFMCILFFGTLFKDLLLLITQSFQYEPLANGVTLVICLLATLWGMKMAFRGPIVKTTELFSSRWHIKQNGFKIAQISDLHVGTLIGKKYVEDVVQKTNALDADIIVITGDLGDGEIKDLKHDLEPLRHLKAKHGIYYVTGNHEFYWNAKDWTEKVQELGFKVLHNHGLEISLPEKSIWIGGVPDISAHKMQPELGYDPQKAAPAENGKDYYKILLAHQPKSVHGASDAGFDLMMSGHTHNGQFFPINFFVGFFNPYHKGLNLHQDMHVYVNVGTGFWGPPQRLGIPAEITCLMLMHKA